MAGNVAPGKWLLQFAGKADGFARAFNDLGFQYEPDNENSKKSESHLKGSTGVIKDARRAKELYQAAAELGNVEAQHNTGMCYFVGNGVEEDLVQAMV